MKTSLMRLIRYCMSCGNVGLAGISYADLPQVIGNFEDSNDGWVVNAEAPDGTTAQSIKENATLGNGSLQGVCAVRLAKGRNAGFDGRRENAGRPRQGHEVTD